MTLDIFVTLLNIYIVGFFSFPFVLGMISDGSLELGEVLTVVAVWPISLMYILGAGAKKLISG